MQRSPRNVPTGRDSQTAWTSEMGSCLRQWPVAGSKPRSSGGGHAAKSTMSPSVGPMPASNGDPRYVAISR